MRPLRRAPGSAVVRLVPLVALLVAIPAASAGSPTPADPLRRRVDWGAEFRSPGAEPAAIVLRVEPNGPAARAGLRADDRILSVNGRRTADSVAWGGATRLLRAGDRIVLRVRRGTRELDLRWVAAPLPREEVPELEIEYGAVTTERGHRLRTLITRPAGATDRLPAMLLVPWLSCYSIETLVRPGDGVDRVLQRLATRSGFVLMRVEKPGLGDSEGPDCAQADLHDELAGHRAALRALLEHPFVDRSAIFVLGFSLGGALAPIVTEGVPIRGYVVSGGFTKTWLEHMLEHERRRLALLGKAPGEINDAMRGYTTFYDLYLNGKMTPAEVLARRPDLAPLWSDRPEHQYGRPAAFYHQVQALNVERAWERATAPVLVVYGEHDWIMTRDDHEWLARTMNARRDGWGTLHVVPGMGHDFNVYPTARQAFDGTGGRFDQAVADAMITWMKRRLAP